MKDIDYSNKMVKTNSLNKLRTDNYVLISPTGNQYSVTPKNLIAFKNTMRVDDSWIIKEQL